MTGVTPASRGRSAALRAEPVAQSQAKPAAANAAQLLSELREPPVVGRYYMVPVIDYRYCGKVDAWPTLGPLHHDRGDVGFDYLHFHVDARFLTGKQAQFLRRKHWHGTVEKAVASSPLCTLYEPVPPQARLERRRCRVSSWAYSPPSKAPWMDKFDARYGKIAEPIRVKGGRLLCPHRKVDLSSFPPDENGIVICPLHGLKVRCTASVDGRRMAETGTGSVRSTTSAVGDSRDAQGGSPNDRT